MQHTSCVQLQALSLLLSIAIVVSSHQLDSRTEILIVHKLCVIIPSESCPNRGDIRLQNGTNSFEGRVEVCDFRNNTTQTLIWKTVCNAGWGYNEAQVVCTQLGFSENSYRMLRLSQHNLSNLILRWHCTSFQLSL